MKTEKLHVRDVGPTLTCMEVLTSVAKRIALRDWRISHEAEETAATGESVIKGYVGVEICRFSKTYREQHLKAIRALIDPLWDAHFGWFGYQLGPSDSDTTSTLAVWFYCRSKAGADGVKKKLEPVATWKLVPAGTEKTEEKNFLRYSTPSSATGDEKEFMRILTSIIPEVGYAAA
jgi:hypothetical protein